jgi:hypothetical protein
MLLIRLKLAPPPPVREPAYDLDRFMAEDAPAAPVSRAVDAKEMEKLRVLEAEMERNLRAGMAQSSASPVPAQQNVSVEESSQLTPDSLRPDERFSATQAEPRIAEKTKEDKSYAGMFYPTVAHAPKKPSPKTPSKEE